jgi:rubrerythrin
MELSREEVIAIAQETAQRVLEGIHRYAVDYKEPQTIEEGLRDSMVEEKTAADWYRRRGMDARLKGDVAKEEDEHYREFQERIATLTKENINAPT